MYITHRTAKIKENSRVRKLESIFKSSKDTLCIVSFHLEDSVFSIINDIVELSNTSIGVAVLQEHHNTVKNAGHDHIIENTYIKNKLKSN